MRLLVFASLSLVACNAVLDIQDHGEGAGFEAGVEGGGLANAGADGEAGPYGESGAEREGAANGEGAVDADGGFADAQVAIGHDDGGPDHADTDTTPRAGEAGLH